MKEQIKKYWFLLVSIAVLILDNGFDAINPILIDMSISPTVVDYIKIGFGLYGLIRLKQSKPISKEV